MMSHTAHRKPRKPRPTLDQLIDQQTAAYVQADIYGTMAKNLGGPGIDWNEPLAREILMQERRRLLDLADEMEAESDYITQQILARWPIEDIEAHMERTGR